MFKVGDEIECVITEIDKDKRRVAISHRLTKDNPFETFEKKFPIGTIVDASLTTLIASACLYGLGSGPIKGFAVTLSIGILTSMFTAIMVTRMLVVFYLRNYKPKKLII